MTGPEEVERKVASVAPLRGVDYTDNTEVQALLQVVDFLHGEYKFMHRAFELACGRVGDRS